MKSKAVERATVASHTVQKGGGVKKRKSTGNIKRSIENSISNLRSMDLIELKKKGQNKTIKSPGPKKSVSKEGISNGVKMSKSPKKEKEKNSDLKKKNDRQRKEVCKKKVVMKKKNHFLSKKVKGKPVDTKGKSKKKESSDRDINQFINLWSIASIGKREASLNATMKVNIMYERQISSKKSSSTESSPVKQSPSPSKTPEKSKRCGTDDTPVKSKLLKEHTNAVNKITVSPNTKRVGPTSSKGSREIKGKIKKGNVRKAADKKNTSGSKGSQNKKRKAQYKIYEDEPATKVRKKENNTKSPKGKAKKATKKSNKTSVLGHSLCNIIEKSPRQASLNAKAMIAMEQEEDLPVEGAARTKVFDWTEIRSCVVSESRKMTWVTGRGDLVGMAKVKTHKTYDAKHTSLSLGDLVDINLAKQESFSWHNTLLKAIHQIGDSRLLKEFLRSQKEDFAGEVDIERCPTPEPVTPVKEPAIPSPKKKPSQPSSTVKKKPEKETTKPIVPSPNKPKPCRVATPIPQFATGQRPNHPSSFVPHPSTQSVYQNLEQHQKQPQPIKVTPYAPSSAYVYQYSPERQQQNIFVSNTPTPLPYSADANDLISRNFPAGFTFNQMGSLSFERRGINPYHPQGNTFNPSLHLPIQPIGFNFPQFYQPSLQQLHNQQNLPSIQPVPLAHQQYPLVPQSSVLQPHALGPNLNPIRAAFQAPYPPYPTPNTEIKQDKPSCMPPPPVVQPLSQASPVKSFVQPLPSYRRAIPINPQGQSSHSLIKPSPEKLTPKTSSNLIPSPSPASSRYTFNPVNHGQQSFCKPSPGNIIHNPQPIRPPAPVQIAFRPICKKESEIALRRDCEKRSSPFSLESQKKSVNPSPLSEESSMSDILHSAHSTMFSVEEKGAASSPSEMPPQALKQNQSVIVLNSSTTKVAQPTSMILGSKSNDKDFKGAYSVSSILEMPEYKLKTEPTTKSCSVNTEQRAPIDLDKKNTKREAYFICIPTPKTSLKAGTSLLSGSMIPLKDNLPPQQEIKKPLDPSIKQFPNDDKVIVIDDSDSSDDEPLAKLVLSKPAENLNNKPDGARPEAQKNKNFPRALKFKLFEEKTKAKPAKSKEVKAKLNKKDSKENNNSGKLVAKQSKGPKPKPKTVHETSCKPPVVAKNVVKNDKLSQEQAKDNAENVSDDIPPISNMLMPSKKTGMTKKAPARRKSKTQQLSIPPILPKVKATHGWSWIGEGEWRTIPKLTMHKEEGLRQRKSYRSMKHASGEVISVKDCVILQSDGDGSAPFVGKISALWENLNGDMMFSMLWYYQPEHTATGREPEDGEQELFASKHREENSVACIDDKCYVLMYNEYCRMEADAVRQELGLPVPSSHVIPPLSQEDKAFLRPLPPSDACIDNIWFCRYDYDIRKKIVRKPKHKKSDLRYRGPCKLVQ